ncbi:MAG: 5-oxoprolinase subunit PxpB [Gammaproteobacteria bacterium]|nr:5-oxoprolinase subunit PxpB [Gammaproteobacteria bacterium]NNF48271.1 5-oxoprolinase subunit PxpB [Woeseiaceae bacterium]MBT8093884.1 5-oxoprolinase subunit PxpB [Gammaproteobacteria bacterium]MBT8104454.1 5-oxoprolinase subunit PxpB [Gammaproteobacteria bacterium]NNK24470.1 5-oxoprolinase subunit PxpB [Woeseiaceae bacterium]
MLTRCGDDLFSVAVDDAADAQALAAQLRDTRRFVDVVPGIDSVVVHFGADAMTASVAQAAIEDALAEGIRPLSTDTALIEIPVVYGGAYGPDLDGLSDTTGLSADEIIALHTSREYRVDMVGFTPGFAFIGGLDDRLRVPRRAAPRQRVEPGSVGIADGRTGLYAMASPGGWTLIGRTPYRLFDATADEPFALQPGMRVRFAAIPAEDFDA